MPVLPGCSEKRKHIRESASEKLSFSVPMVDFREIVNITGTAEVMNKSDFGICLRTAVPLEPGHILRLLQSPASQVSMVKWTSKTGSDLTVAGLMFV